MRGTSVGRVVAVRPHNIFDREDGSRDVRDQGESGSILQVYRAEAEASATAAAAFKAALPGAAIAERVLQGTADKTFWDTVLGAQPAVLVLWLGAEDLAGVAALGATPTVYLSSSLTGAKPLDALLTGGGSIRLIYPSDLPPKREARLLRNKLWLHNKNIALTEETVQMNTQFTMAVMSDVLGHLQDSFSRDYFVERVEHMVTQTPMASIYQQVSLGPGQRFAAKGSAIVQLIDPQKKLLKPLSGWIVP